MTQAHGFGENEARRIADATRRVEGERGDASGEFTPGGKGVQLGPFHKLPSNLVHPVTEKDGFDLSDLDGVCGTDVELVEVRTTDNERFTPIETAFFEGDWFPQELAMCFRFGGSLSAFGGSHLVITGTLDDGVLTVDDCNANTVEWEWLVTPAVIPDGVRVVAAFCRNVQRYVILQIHCEDL
jgi:hypothetical protein